MAEECLSKCPRILASLEVSEGGSPNAIPCPWYSDMPSGLRILQLCRDALRCSGVKEGQTVVKIRSWGSYKPRQTYPGQCPQEALGTNTLFYAADVTETDSEP